MKQIYLDAIKVVASMAQSINVKISNNAYERKYSIRYDGVTIYTTSNSIDYDIIRDKVDLDNLHALYERYGDGKSVHETLNGLLYEEFTEFFVDNDANEVIRYWELMEWIYDQYMPKENDKIMYFDYETGIDHELVIHEISYENNIAKCIEYEGDSVVSEWEVYVTTILHREYEHN